MTGLFFFSPRRLGDMPMELTNTRGGSLSVGHPFGATGALIFLLYWYNSTNTGAEEALVRRAARHFNVLFLLYWYKSTNTGAEEALARRAAGHFNVLFLLYWYKNTNTDAEEALARRAAGHVGLGPPEG
jgi:hypothetical protein